MSTLPIAPPSAFVAGDTVQFTWTDDDYPASAGWALVWAVAGVDVASVTATVDGDTWTVTLAAAASETLRPGQYQWSLRVSKDGAVYTRATGTVDVAAAIGGAGPGQLQSWAERTLPVVEAALSGTLTDAQRSYMIGDVQVVKMSAADLLKVRAMCHAELAAARGQFGTPVKMRALAGSR